MRCNFKRPWAYIIPRLCLSYPFTLDCIFISTNHFPSYRQPLCGKTMGTFLGCALHLHTSGWRACGYTDPSLVKNYHSMELPFITAIGYTPQGLRINYIYSSKSHDFNMDQIQLIIWVHVCQKQISRSGTSDCISWVLWGVITSISLFTLDTCFMHTSPCTMQPHASVISVIIVGPCLPRELYNLGFMC